MPIIQYKHTKAQRGLLSAIFFIVGAFLLFPVFQLPGFGLDPSWMLGLNMAFDQHLHFGRDIVFTYGPLGFLSTHMPILIPKWLFLVFDVLSVTMLLFIFDDIRRNLPFHPLLSLLIVLFTLVPLAYQNFDYVFLLYFASIWLYMKGEMWHMTLAGALALLAFYIKLNVGIILLILFPIMVIIQCCRLFISRWNALKLIFVYLLAFFMFDLILGVEPFDYVQGGIHLINGFNDAMRQSPVSESDNWHMYSAIIIFLIFLAFNVLQLIHGRFSWDYLFLLGTGSFFLFLLFKSSFTRYDEWHYPTFFVFRSLPVLLALRFLPVKNRFVKAGALLLLFIVPWKMSYMPTFLSAKPQQLVQYVKVIKKGDQVLLADVKVPEVLKPAPEFRKKIGNRSIDIHPFIISILYYNKMNYRPRPVIQSYMSFNGWLDSLNADFYKTPRAPKYILYNLNNIDNRYALFDETKTRLSILQYYTAVDFNHDIMLLEKRDTPLEIKEKTLSTGVLKLEDEFKLPETDGLLMLKTDIRYNKKGKLARMLLRAPQLYISLIYEDGSRNSFRLINSIANSGIIVNRLVNGMDDLLKFQAAGIEGLKKIRAIRIYSPDQKQFVLDIPYKLSKISVQGNNDYNPVDSINVITPKELIQDVHYKLKEEKLDKKIMFTVNNDKKDTLRFIGIRNKYTGGSKLIHALLVDDHNSDASLENPAHFAPAYCALINKDYYNPLTDEIIAVRKRGKTFEYVVVGQ